MWAKALIYFRWVVRSQHTGHINNQNRVINNASPGLAHTTPNHIKMLLKDALLSSQRLMVFNTEAISRMFTVCFGCTT